MSTMWSNWQSSYRKLWFDYNPRMSTILYDVNLILAQLWFDYNPRMSTMPGATGTWWTVLWFDYNPRMSTINYYRLM